MPASQPAGQAPSSAAARPPSPAALRAQAATLLGVHKGPLVALSLQDRGGEQPLSLLYGRPYISLSVTDNLRTK